MKGLVVTLKIFGFETSGAKLLYWRGFFKHNDLIDWKDAF